MLKYLVILLDDTSTSYCHYNNEKSKPNLIALEDLKAGILYAMKENLTIQFVYPTYELPEEYKELIYSVEHNKIVPIEACESGEVVVCNSWKDLNKSHFDENSIYIFRTDKKQWFKNYKLLADILEKITRLNVMITDIETFTEEDFKEYKFILEFFSKELEQLYLKDKFIQLNLLTDRIMLTAMNNCNAGDENITLAPDGKFYICPAFYQANSKTTIEEKATSIGNIKSGLNIKNPQLLRLSHAPLCRNCDAYQCKRCVWLNRKSTLEINTPSHEQCVISHLERNTSRELLSNIRKHKVFMPDKEIKEITYLDPFDVRKEW